MSDKYYTGVVCFKKDNSQKSEIYKFICF